MKFKGLLLAFVLALPCSTQISARVKDEYNEKKKQKPSALADFFNTALGVGCIAGAFYTGTQTLSAYDAYMESGKEGFWHNISDFVGQFAESNKSTHTIVKRWQTWKEAHKFTFGESDYSEYVPVAELGAWGIATGVLGIAGLQFIAKGIHLKK